MHYWAFKLLTFTRDARTVCVADRLTLDSRQPLAMLTPVLIHKHKLAPTYERVRWHPDGASMRSSQLGFEWLKCFAIAGPNRTGSYCGENLRDLARNPKSWMSLTLSHLFRLPRCCPGRPDHSSVGQEQQDVGRSGRVPPPPLQLGPPAASDRRRVELQLALQAKTLDVECRLCRPLPGAGPGLQGRVQGGHSGQT